ncbi:MULTISPECIES: acyltransferase family protein [Sphingomonas]|uniref:acyltransferase family protein n=1 Tax=Sphingomonas TaxID=13687 RepID=UPI000DEF0BA2|nr:MULTISPECIES: acyltransferase [Sphingomonas]
MKRDYPGLDLIRFGAALLVALYHLGLWWWLPGQLDRPDLAVHGRVAAGLAGSGWIGVQIFFVLSGFVIAFTADGRDARRFLKNRALRLYPTAWLCAPLTLLIAGGSAEALARALLLAPTGPWISGAYWTLPIEIVFYLTVAAALAGRVDLSRLAAGLTCWSAGYWLVRSLDFVVGKPLRPFFALIEGSSWGSLTLLTYGCFFAIGMLLWAVATGKAKRMHLYLLGWNGLAAVLQIVSNAHAIDADNGTAVGIGWPLGLWLGAVGAIGLGIAGNKWILRWLGPRRHWLRIAGLLTYPLYLVHSDVGRVIALAVAPAVGRLAPLLAVGAVMLLSGLVLAVEPWLRRPLKWLLERLFPAPASGRTSAQGE